MQLVEGMSTKEELQDLCRLLDFIAHEICGNCNFGFVQALLRLVLQVSGPNLATENLAGSIHGRAFWILMPCISAANSGASTARELNRLCQSCAQRQSLCMHSKSKMRYCTSHDLHRIHLTREESKHKYAKLGPVQKQKLNISMGDAGARRCNHAGAQAQEKVDSFGRGDAADMGPH